MKSLIAVLLIAFPVVTRAHDFWIEPSTFHPERGSIVAVRLRVGQQYLGDPVPRKPASQLVRFEAHHAAGVAPVIGRDLADPAGMVAVPSEGLMLVAYHSKPAYVELPEDKLQQYLREEGEERIHEVRARSPFAGQPWREMYSRCAKSLLSTGSGSAAVFNKHLGLPLELIPEKDPYALAAGSTLPVRLLHRGKPLAGALIVAIPKADPAHPVSARSDRNGLVRLTLPSSGPWLIKAVHIDPAPAGAPVQWESVWASLTFDMPAH